MSFISTNFISAQTIPSDFWQSFEKNITISELQENYSNALFGDTNTFVLMNHGIEIPSQENYSFQSNIAVNVLDKNIILDQSISEFFVIHEAKINATQVTRKVYAVDTTVPNVLTQNIQLFIGATTNLTVTSSDIDNGTSDAGGIASLVVSPDTFTCTDIGINVITLTATDLNGNSASAMANVDVQLSCTGSIGLNPWSQEGISSAGNWSVGPDGAIVFQSINGSPTFFLSPDSFFNTVIEGGFGDETSLDDDIIFIAFG
jgi:hypothetical protein